MAEQALFQPFNRNQQRENLESTKETGLLISLIPSLQEDFYVDSLTTGASKETLSKLLLRNPGIKNETAVIEMIHFLHDEGDRISFSILLPFLVAEYDPKELEEKIRERFFGIELFIRKCNNLHHFITCIKADPDILSIVFQQMVVRLLKQGFRRKRRLIASRRDAEGFARGH